MTMKSRNHLGVALIAALPLCVLFAAGCSKPEESAPSAPAGGGPAAGGPGGMQGGGPGGMRGGPGGPGGMRGGPVAESASGAEIYQAKCNCHGPEGKGGRAPQLAGTTQSTDDLYKIVHDGKQKMPAFGSQLSEAQIKKVVDYLKTLK